MPWERRSRRHAELPADWPAIRAAVLDRDQYRCQIGGPRCAGAAREVDHVDERDDHSVVNLRAACPPCHGSRTAQQGHAAMRALRESTAHRAERHPGLL